MNTIVICIVFTGCLLSCTTAKKNTGNYAYGSDTAVIKKLEYDWLAAEFKLDTATIAAMMDESFVSVGSKGISGKQEDLKGMYDNISQRLRDRHVIDSFYLDEMRIQIYDNTAVVVFVVVTRGRIKEIAFENRRTRFYDVWVKRHGQWKAVSSQGTAVQ